VAIENIPFPDAGLSEADDGDCFSAKRGKNHYGGPVREETHSLHSARIGGIDHGSFPFEIDYVSEVQAVFLKIRYPLRFNPKRSSWDLSTRIFRGRQ
jgi:hypothetical protein